MKIEGIGFGQRGSEWRGIHLSVLYVGLAPRHFLHLPPSRRHFGKAFGCGRVYSNSLQSRNSGLSSAIGVRGRSLWFAARPDPWNDQSTSPWDAHTALSAPQHSGGL